MGQLTFAPASESQGPGTRMDNLLRYSQSLSNLLVQRGFPACQPLKVQTVRRQQVAWWAMCLERL